MDDIEVKAELAALCGPKVEADNATSGAEVPHDDPATPTESPDNGIRISNVVSMAASTKSEVVLPDVVGSAVHAVIELEPDELPAAPASISGGICFPTATTREPLDFSFGPKQHPMTVVEPPPNPVSVAEHETVVNDGVITDPAAVKAEREPSPEVVDLTEDAPSSPPAPLSEEPCELDEKPVDLGEAMTTAQESSPQTGTQFNIQ